MHYTNSGAFCRTAGSFILFAGMLFASAAVHADSSSDSSAPPAGRINFEDAKLPAATVEVDLSQEMFKDLFGIGDAAVAGVAETLLKSVEGNDGAKGTRMATEQMAAARQIIQLAGNVVHEVRVRVYDGLPEGTGDAQALCKPFDEQLRSNKWETLVRVSKDKQTARVSALCNDGAVQGVFVVVADGDNVVLANIVCDVSPENVKKLTSAVTKIGLQNGLGNVIELKMNHFPGMMERRAQIEVKGGKVLINGVVTGVAPIAPTAPPAPPAPPAKPAAR